LVGVRGFEHGVEDYVGDTRSLCLVLVHDHHHDYVPANLYHSHNLVPHDDVMLGNHERSTHEEEIGSENAGLRNGLVVISQVHDNHFGHVILLVLHPSHFGYFDFDSE
jgi:hypothetical protein